jgi:hypothetical protein
MEYRKKPEYWSTGVMERRKKKPEFWSGGVMEVMHGNRSWRVYDGSATRSVGFQNSFLWIQFFGSIPQYSITPTLQ